jgi:hypothetical protein
MPVCGPVFAAAAAMPPLLLLLLLQVGVAFTRFQTRFFQGR